MPYRQIGAISNDPVDPVGAYGHVERLRDLSPGTIDTLVEVAGTGSNSPLTILEVRQLGGALGRPPTQPSPIGHRNAPFIVNGIGMTPTPDEAKRVQAYLAYVATALRPHDTGATYVNFLELTDVTPERVRAAYSAEDWERLIALKNRYDPDDLFRFNRNIPPTSSAGA
jgi:berberine-like enzyme